MVFTLPVAASWFVFSTHVRRLKTRASLTPLLVPLSQNLRFAAGHDEYMYRMLVSNKVPLADIPDALAIVRLHSCYPWHKGGAYRQFHAADGSDDRLLEVVRRMPPSPPPLPT